MKVPVDKDGNALIETDVKKEDDDQREERFKITMLLISCQLLAVMSGE